MTPLSFFIFYCSTFTLYFLAQRGGGGGWDILGYDGTFLSRFPKRSCRNK